MFDKESLIAGITCTVLVLAVLALMNFTIPALPSKSELVAACEKVGTATLTETELVCKFKEGQ